MVRERGRQEAALGTGQLLAAPGRRGQHCGALEQDKWAVSGREREACPEFRRVGEAGAHGRVSLRLAGPFTEPHACGFLGLGRRALGQQHSPLCPVGLRAGRAVRTGLRQPATQRTLDGAPVSVSGGGGLGLRPVSRSSAALSRL